MTGNVIATDGGRYRVFVDGVEVSAHTQQHTAQSRLRTEQLKAPESEVMMAADFEYRYEPSDEELECFEPDEAVLEIVGIDITPVEPEPGEAFTVNVEIAEIAGVQTDGLSVGLVVVGAGIDQTITPNQLSDTVATVTFDGLAIADAGDYTAVVTADAENAQAVRIEKSFSVAEVDAPEPGIGEVIPHDQSELNEYPDPTTLEHYQEYPVDPHEPYVLDQSLADIAASMEPGEWRQLPSAPYLAPSLWGDKAMWDANRQRVSYLGLHGRPRPIRWGMVDFGSGEMHRQVGDKFHPYAGIHSEWGFRAYGHYAQLPDGSNLYARFSRVWKQNPDTLEWSAWVMHPRYTTIGNLEYFPEMGAVVSLGNDWVFAAYFVGEDQWRQLPVPKINGHHSMMRYNPVRGEVMILGGDKSFRDAQILKPDGSLVDCAPVPRDTSIRVGQLAVDPVSGHYLHMCRENDAERGKTTEDVEFLGYDADVNEWYLISEWHEDRSPFTSRHAAPVVAVLPEHGVTFWSETVRSGMHLYKHKAPE